MSGTTTRRSGRHGNAPAGTPPSVPPAAPATGIDQALDPGGADQAGPPGPEQSTLLPRLVDPAQVAALQSVRATTCLSILMATTPAARMTDADADRLRDLADDAERRLAGHSSRAAADRTKRHLAQLVEQAVLEPTASGLALYCAADQQHRVWLPLRVADRVVIDPSFATRDLLRSLHRTPRHLVLLLGNNHTQLFIGQGPYLMPAIGSSFPRVAPAAAGRRGGPARSAPGGSRSDGDLTHYLRQVDRALGNYRLLHPSPIVLAGPARLVSAFQQTSRHLERLAGTVTGDHAGSSMAELTQQVRPVLDEYLHSRQAEALQLLEQRAGADRVVSGLPAVWLAAHYERVEMLAVEDTLVYPARLSDNGDLLEAASDVEAPDVLDDAVDELIELIIARGGWVALLEEGSLAGHDRVAVCLAGSR